MTCNGMPGITLLSIAGVPSSFSSFRDSVVRKPPIAGPKPTQAISTSMLARSTIGCSAVLKIASSRIVECLGNHDLRERFSCAIFGQLRTGQASIELGAEPLNRLQSLTGRTRPGLRSMRAVLADHVMGTSADAWDEPFQFVQFVTVVTAFVAFLIPRWMAVVTENQFGADAAHLARSTRRLDVTQVGEQIQRAGEPFGKHRILRPMFFQLHHIQNKLPRRKQPGKRVAHREGHAL